MEMALDLPEIRLLIGMYLDHHELTQCIRVCATWHASFIHFLWGTVEVNITSGEPYPTVDAITKHRTLIKDLTIWTDYSTVRSLTQTYPRLEYLSINSGVENGALLSDLLDLNPTITTLEMYNIDSSDHNLRKLELDLPESPDIHQQLQFIRLCTNLVNLDWALFYDTDAAFFDSLTCSLAKIWPTLECLKLKYSEISDKNLASILACMKRIKALDVRLTGFGDLSFQVLRSHFGTLEKLDLLHCKGVTDAMICEILQSCHKLRELTLGRVRVRELGLLSPQSRPWKCSLLRRLKLEFIFESRASTPSPLLATENKESEEQDYLMQLVYERLSHLTQLEILNVGHDPLYVGRTALLDPCENHLQFSLSKGLRQLCRLKRMCLVSASETRQEMNKQDVEWMLEHWKHFQEFFGSMNEDPEIMRALMIMIYRRNGHI
ncbi:hypothetical protein BGZ50_009599 [Haplosporangium sp. Z 11]|nr:hypothetical protein BGZ50_009599 [Haplosporangium sp. Z 11]